METNKQTNIIDTFLPMGWPPPQEKQLSVVLSKRGTDICFAIGIFTSQKHSMTDHKK
jgi:hypothetical protein